MESATNAQPLKKASMLKYLKESLFSILEKAAITLGPMSILHRVLFEYMSLSQDNQSDLVELLKDHLANILHTREGARVVQLCMTHGK